MEQLVDRRQFTRHQMDLPTEIVATDGPNLLEGTMSKVVNISKCGLCWRTMFLVPVASLLSLSVFYGGHDSLLLAEVIWRTGNETEGFTYGLKIRHWIYLDDALATAIS